MSNFRKFISMSAVAVLGVTNLLTPLSYASAADVIQNYDAKVNPISTGESFSFIMPDHHVYLKAYTVANEYFVRYEGNNHTSGEMGTGKFTYDSHTGHLAPNAFAKTGYTWSSWNTGADGNGTPYASGAEVFNWTTVENGVVPVYAQWIANKYNIDYDLNPTNTGTSTPVHNDPHPTDATYDSPFEVSNPTRTGYTFSGWDITNMDSEQHTVGGNASSATGASGVKGTGFNNLRATSGTVHFAAKWTANQVPYRVEHYLQNLSGAYEIQTGDTQNFTGTADTEVKPPVKPYTGFTPRPSDTPTSGNIEPDGGKVFKYHYTRDSYNLTINVGRGVASVKGVGTVNTTGATTNSSTGISFKYDEPVTLSFVMKDGYTGGTWSGYLNEDASFNMPAFSTGKTAYATPIVYTITYNTRSGTVSPANPTIYTVESGQFTLTNPDRYASKFAGWTGGVVGGTQLAGPTMTVTISAQSTGDRSYTATWTCLSGYHLSDDMTACLPESDTQYHVKHYFQTLTGGEDFELRQTTTQTGQTEQDTDAKTIAHEGFTPRTINNVPITGDGSTVVSIRYDRNSYTGTVADPEGVDADSIEVTVTADHPAGTDTYKYGDTVTLDATLQSGYIFNGWTVTRKDNGQSVTVSGANSLSGATFQMPASEVTITPKVTIYPYTITYELHSGSVATGNKTEYNVETPTFTLTNPTRDHSKFVGWSGGVIGETPTTTTSVTIAKGSVGNRSYEAIWECDTGYHKNGENECVANEYTVTIDYKDAGNDLGSRTGEVTLTYDSGSTIPNPTQSGYTFSGWIITGLSGDDATVDGKELTPPEDTTTGTLFENLTPENGGNVTFVADWTPNDDTKYTVYHYYENLNADDYFLSGTVDYEGVTNDPITIDSSYYRVKSGFAWAGIYLTGGTERPTDGSTNSTNILKDGSRKIYIYYQRRSGDVYLSGDVGITALWWTKPSDQLYTGARRYEFEDEVKVRAEPKAGYHFKEWRKKTNSEFTTDGNGNEG